MLNAIVWSLMVIVSSIFSIPILWEEGQYAAVLFLVVISITTLLCCIAYCIRESLSNRKYNKIAKEVNRQKEARKHGIISPTIKPLCTKLERSDSGWTQVIDRDRLEREYIESYRRRS